jgi:hypothetical protein
MSDFEARNELEQAVTHLLGAAQRRREAPVYLADVARQLGVTICDRRGTAEGRLCLKGGRATIEVSPDVRGARRRFTIAHELGHAFLLHPDRPLSGATVDRWPTEEAFCNDFAATVLLPRAWLESQLVDTPPTLAALLRLAHTSQVSPTACAVRLLNSGLWRRGLLVLVRNTNESWWLRTAVGLSRRLHARFQLATDTAQMLHRLRYTSDSSRLRLDLLIADSHRSMHAHVAFRTRTCIAFFEVRGGPGTWEPAWILADRQRPNEQLSLLDDLDDTRRLFAPPAETPLGRQPRRLDVTVGAAQMSN